MAQYPFIWIVGTIVFLVTVILTGEWAVGRLLTHPLARRQGARQGVWAGAVTAILLLLTGPFSALIAVPLIVALVGLGGWAGDYLAARRGDCRALLLPPSALLGFVYSGILTGNTSAAVSIALVFVGGTLAGSYAVRWDAARRRLAAFTGIGLLGLLGLTELARTVLPCG